jgi:transketolase
VRGAFINTLVELAATDKRILLLTGDLGYMALEPFAEAYPDRFFNVGVAEQNMVGMATGLAEAGFTPFVYSIVTFAVLRPFEFIRNGPVHHRLPVRIVGVGGGLEYGHNGTSHHGLEDVAVLRSQPGMTVVCPADHQQTRTALEATSRLPGPIYYRLGKDDKTVVPGLDGRFEIERTQTIGNGTDLLILTMGGVSNNAVLAAHELANQGISCTVMVIASVKPAPEADLIEALGRFPIAFTVEAHYIEGGIGSLVSEVVAENGIPCRVVRCGVSSLPNGITGSQSYLHDIHGISVPALVQRAARELGKSTRSTNGLTNVR